MSRSACGQSVSISPLICADLLKKRIERELSKDGEVQRVPEDHPRLKYRVVKERVESIYTWQCGGLAYPTREMQGSALRRSIAGCCKKFPQATIRAASG